MSSQLDTQHHSTELQMVDSSSFSNNSLTMNNNKSLDECNSDSCSTNEKMNITIFENGKRNKCNMTSSNYQQLIDKLREIEQIKCEENLVYEQINRIHIKKQHIQKLKNILHSTNTNNRMKNSRYRQRRIQKLNSNSDLN